MMNKFDHSRTKKLANKWLEQTYWQYMSGLDKFLIGLHDPVAIARKYSIGTNGRSLLDALYEGRLGEAVQIVVVAACEQGGGKTDVNQACVTIASVADDEFYKTEFGWVVVNVVAWSTGDEIVTQTEAAQQVGVKPTAIRNAVRDGRLTTYTDPSENHPNKARRVLLSQVRSVLS